MGSLGSVHGSSPAAALKGGLERRLQQPHQDVRVQLDAATLHSTSSSRRVQMYLAREGARSTVPSLGAHRHQTAQEPSVIQQRRPVCPHPLGSPLPRQPFDTEPWQRGTSLENQSIRFESSSTKAGRSAPQRCVTRMPKHHISRTSFLCHRMRILAALLFASSDNHQRWGLAKARQRKLAEETRSEVKLERQEDDVYEATTKVLFPPSEVNCKLLRALSITRHIGTFAKLPVQGIATCCCWVNSPAVNPPCCA